MAGLIKETPMIRVDLANEALEKNQMIDLAKNLDIKEIETLALINPLFEFDVIDATRIVKCPSNQLEIDPFIAASALEKTSLVAP